MGKENPTSRVEGYVGLGKLSMCFSSADVTLEVESLVLHHEGQTSCRVISHFSVSRAEGFPRVQDLQG